MGHRLEKEIEEATRAVLRRNGFVEEKNHQTMLNWGRLDLHVGHEKWGEWWVEMKRPGQKLGTKQWKWMLKWEMVCNIIVCDDETRVLDIIKKQRRTFQTLRRDQWGPWMTRAQKREVLSGRTPLDDAMDDWS